MLPVQALVALQGPHAPSTQNATVAGQGKVLHGLDVGGASCTVHTSCGHQGNNKGGTRSGWEEVLARTSRGGRECTLSQSARCHSMLTPAQLQQPGARSHRRSSPCCACYESMTARTGQSTSHPVPPSLHPTHQPRYGLAKRWRHGRRRARALQVLHAHRGWPGRRAYCTAIAAGC